MKVECMCIIYACYIKCVVVSLCSFSLSLVFNVCVRARKVFVMCGIASIVQQYRIVLINIEEGWVE